MIHYQSFRITGVANSTTYDSGLKSTEARKKRLLSLLLQVSGIASNDIQGWHEQEKVTDIPDEMLDTDESTGSTNTQKAMSRLNEVDVGLDIPAGETYKIAIKCGATNKNLVGMYRYEVI